ncbi:MAG TPA: PIN domain-containing protein [Polyangiaceae bacterium]|jgi:predicted nucleic acid-binding protein|nr:PIN domain-containing protein [Polyangiaceae bacterium]
MAEALILDAEAVNALANQSGRKALALRASAVLSIAYDKRALVRVPAPVLAEVCRGVRYDSAINHLLNSPGVGVADLTRKVAQQAGHLLARHRLSSAHAIDAFVVATALQFDTAVIATGDPKDIRRLAAPYSRIGIFPL